MKAVEHASADYPVLVDLKPSIEVRMSPSLVAVFHFRAKCGTDFDWLAEQMARTIRFRLCSFQVVPTSKTTAGERLHEQQCALRGHAMQGDLISEVHADALARRRRIRRHTCSLDLRGAHVTPEKQIETLVQIPPIFLEF